MSYKKFNQTRKTNENPRTKNIKKNHKNLVSIWEDINNNKNHTRKRKRKY